MRMNLFVILSALLVFGCASSSIPDREDVSPKITVGQSHTENAMLWVGMDREAVFELLGPADFIFYGDEQFDINDSAVEGYHVYPRLDVSLLIQQTEVTEITLLGPLAVSSNGLYGGMPLSEAVTILGDRFEIHPAAGKDFYYFPRQNISLEVSEGAELASQINIRAP